MHRTNFPRIQKSIIGKLKLCGFPWLECLQRWLWMRGLNLIYKHAISRMVITRGHHIGYYEPESKASWTSRRRNPGIGFCQFFCAFQSILKNFVEICYYCFQKSKIWASEHSPVKIAFRRTLLLERRARNKVLLEAPYIFLNSGSISHPFLMDNIYNSTQQC